MRAVISALLVLVAVGSDAGIEDTILHGVSVAGVRFHVLPDEVPGLTEADGTAMMKARLGAAGIPVTGGDGAILRVIASVFADHSPTCNVNLEGQLVEEANLLRNGLRVSAESWRGGGTSITTSHDLCAQEVRKAIDRAMDEFVDIYQAMNPQP